MEISEKTIKFIQEHSKDDTNTLRLKYAGKSTMMDIPIEFALLQIESRRKAQKKIPTFIEHPSFIFPDALAAEQASNEAVARYHASLISPESTLLDLTAGLGIDDLTFAMAGINVTACEIDKTKAEALTHNAETLGLGSKISVNNVDSMSYIEECKKHFDVVFSDPARRTTAGKRVHALAECQPDILKAMDRILQITDRLIIKSSPLLDLSLIRNTVDNLCRIHVVCFKGECKEVLIDIQKGKEFEGIKVIDLDMKRVISHFETHLSPIESKPMLADAPSPACYRYLYEPNAGVMKTGAWGELNRQYPDIRKADINSHIFLSDTFFEGFPGRITQIEGIIDKKAMKNLKGKKCNVVARNHPLSATEIAKRYSLKPGDDTYLYAFRYHAKPVGLLARQIKALIFCEMGPKKEKPDQE
ncbi:MAG: class I SAM-dependent methyltransferase [Muribaculaceae bacterium]|nr:class I SAM-dependent methyltransferase [Muribaculaceae bacterium]